MSKKPPTITKLKKKLWKLIAKTIKERDTYTCWLCNKRGNGKDIHCSHILPKGQYPRYEFDEWNLKSLCMRCHIAFWHKNPIEVALKFKSKYPEKYKEALKKAKEYKGKSPYKKADIERLIKKYEGPITW